MPDGGAQMPDHWLANGGLKLSLTIWAQFALNRVHRPDALGDEKGCHPRLRAGRRLAGHLWYSIRPTLQCEIANHNV